VYDNIIPLLKLRNLIEIEKSNQIK